MSDLIAQMGRLCRGADITTNEHGWIPYRGYWIEYDPPPIPTWQQHAWRYVHDSYDGAPDSHDHRFGSASSLEEAKREIDEQIASDCRVR